jgi:hypothetical protein
VGERYLAYIRTFVKSHVAESKDGRRRAVGISHCRELNRDWSPIVNVLAADDRDDAKVAPLGKDPGKPDWAELYCMNFFPYGNHYLGLLSLLYLVDGWDGNGGGDLQLTFSHDGLAWHRQPERTTLIAPSNAPGLFPTYISTNAPLEIGDELWLYYTEANGAHPIAPFEKAVSQIRAAVWRRDGFVSLDADQRAMLRTKPLVLGGNKLVLNLNTAADGFVRVAILDERGDPLPNLGMDACDPIRGDQVRAVASWRGNADLTAVQDRPVILKLDVARAKLFSFRASHE